jgi:Yip1 domain
MTMDVSGAKAPNLVDRAKAIILSPKAEWAKIDSEPADIGKLYTGYALPLAAAAAIAAAIGMAVFGVGAFGFSYRLPLTAAISGAVVQIVLSMLGVFVFANILNWLAPNFGSQANIGQAHKLAVYSYTAAFLAGLFSIFPPLGILGILGFYSFYLLHTGMPALMKTPEDKRVGYIVAAIVAAIVLWLVVGAVVGAATRTFGPTPGIGPFGAATQSGSSEGTVKLPNGGEVNLSELEKAAKQMEALGAGAAAGGTVAGAVDPAKLQALLPAALPGGFARESIESGNATGVGAATAEGAYRRGDSTIHLTVVHLGPMGAMAGLAAAAGVNANREDANGYERTRTVDGRVLTEEVNRSAKTAKYAIIGKKGAAVTVEGTNISIEEARAAAETVRVEAVEALGG